MWVILGMHLVQFVMNHKIFYTVDVASNDDDFQAADAKVAEDHSSKDEDEKFPYVDQARQFYKGMWWLWIIQAVLYVGVIGAYFMIEGKEMVYAIYIPLDIMLTVSLGFYYYTTYRAEQQLQDREEKMKELVMNKFAGGLMKSLNADKSDAGDNTARRETVQKKM